MDDKASRASEKVTNVRHQVPFASGQMFIKSWIKTQNHGVTRGSMGYVYI